MQAKTCLLEGHQQKDIDNLCTHPNCKLSRFLCSQCANLGIHKHESITDSHILDNEQLHSKITEAINQDQAKKSRIDQLKQLAYEIQNQVTKILNVIHHIEEGTKQLINSQYLQQEPLKENKSLIHQLDEQLLNSTLFMLNKQQYELQITQQLELQSNIIITGAERVKEWGQAFYNDVFSVKISYQMALRKIAYFQEQSLMIKNILQLEQWIILLRFGIIEVYNLLCVDFCVFTKDSTLLYIGDTAGKLQQYDIQDKFKLLFRKQIHNGMIKNIVCISNQIILTSSKDKTIVKTDIQGKQKLLEIQAHNESVIGLDYHFGKNLIASGSGDRSIKIWDSSDGSLLIEQQNAVSIADEFITQVIFLINKNWLVSQSTMDTVIWNINYESKQLEQIKQINESCCNISLALNEQYIIQVLDYKIRFYSIYGELIREINHDLRSIGIYLLNIGDVQYSPIIITRGNLYLRIILNLGLQNCSGTNSGMKYQINIKQISNILLIQLIKLHQAIFIQPFFYLTWILYDYNYILQKRSLEENKLGYWFYLELTSVKHKIEQVSLSTLSI